jgi:hypothetical protein
MMLPAIGLLLVHAVGAHAQTYDVVVYGGTAGGVITAVSAARQADVSPRGEVPSAA